MARRKIPEAIREEARARFLDGQRSCEIQKALGVSKGFVDKIVKRLKEGQPIPPLSFDRAEPWAERKKQAEVPPPNIIQSDFITPPTLAQLMAGR